MFRIETYKEEENDMIDSASWIERTGTMSLDPALMREIIFFGRLVQNEDGTLARLNDCGGICITLWANILPPPFREKALQKFEQVAKEFSNEKATGAALIAIIHNFQAEMYNAFKDGELTTRGWV